MGEAYRRYRSYGHGAFVAATLAAPFVFMLALGFAAGFMMAAVAFL